LPQEDDQDATPERMSLAVLCASRWKGAVAGQQGVM
jgi:hypothetical protein